MTDVPQVSLVVVSRQRPKELQRLLTSLQFLDYPKFELIVVSDRDPRKTNPGIPNITKTKFVFFDKANISAARNAGIENAAGQIIAFCDDDAVPEPTWLSYLVKPFKDGSVGAAGGYVLGRNGITFQWQGRKFDRSGQHAELNLKTRETVVLQGNAEESVKTEGTNCAFRTEVLLAVGGFDQNFHYYLDETDLNYRLGLKGWKTAIVPMAQVHHGFAASAVRTSRRAPRDLTEIGASKAYFCKRHLEPEKVNVTLEEFSKAQRKRLITYMISGEIEPHEIKQLLYTLHLGLKAGLRRELKADNLTSDSKFQNFATQKTDRPRLALAGRPFNWWRMRRLARGLVARGMDTTVFQFSFTSFFHRMRFHQDGYWLQTGGIYGRSSRRSRVFKLTTILKRAQAEVDRISQAI